MPTTAEGRWLLGLGLLVAGTLLMWAIPHAWRRLLGLPPDRPVTDPAVLRHLALSAIYSKLNGRHDRSLCGHDTLDDAACIQEGFHDIWEIPRVQPKPEVLRLLDGMHLHGHRMSKNMVECTVRRAMHEHPTEAFDTAKMRAIAQKALLAWDVTRYADLVRDAYYVGYLSRGNTLKHLKQAYQLTAGQFASWEEFGRSFVLAKHAFDSQLSPSYLARVTPAGEIERAVAELLGDPDSSWRATG
jgi:hypothetical protein